MPVGGCAVGVWGLSPAEAHNCKFVRGSLPDPLTPQNYRLGLGSFPFARSSWFCVFISASFLFPFFFCV